jgi:2-polyprenyl-3-methyl-5-hydroxy-6-metoxy-1,4-benzoquinol methylase
MSDVGMAHTWSRGGLLTVPVCPMCSGSSRVTIGEATDAMVSSPDRWPLWRCEKCRSQWLDPRPDDASLPAAYDFDYITHRAEAGPARSGFLSSLIDGYLARRFRLQRDGANGLGAWLFPLVPPLRMKLDYYGRHLQPGKGRTLLDIGCGSGDFVATAGLMGWNAEGVDPDAAAVAVCRGRGVVVTEGFVEQIEANKQVGYWDAVTMSHCVEHVADPAALLDQVHAMLAPGGEVWLGLPNPESIGARYFGLDWESIDAPRHLVLPTQAALVTACHAAGFESVRLKRRGAHTGRLFRRSAEIARSRGRRGLRYGRNVIFILSLYADLVATLTPRWGDETVLVARKRVAR